MQKKEWKILYLNIVIFIAFLSAIAIVFYVFNSNKQIALEQVVIASICAPIIVGAIGFWTYELKHLFRKEE